MKRKLLTFLSMMFIASISLFAADAASYYDLFSSSLSDPAKAISYYEDMEKSIEKESRKLKKSLDKAYSARNAAKANEAYSNLAALNQYKITKEQSDELLSAIIKNGSDKDSLRWLYENSSYYNPVLTLSYSYRSANRTVYKTRSVSVAPGESVTLPDSSSLTLESGVFSGWGIVEGEVTYKPGETIEMPATSQTLYAVYKSAVAFNDPLSDFNQVIDDVKSGDVITVPSLTSDDKSAYFEGWADGNGTYIAPDDSEYTVEGMGSTFTALWDKASIGDLKADYYDLSSIPVNTQVSMSFKLNNSGTEELKNIKVKLTSADPALKVIKNSAYARYLSPDSSISFVGFVVVGSKTGSYSLTLTAEDGDGHIWAEDFQVTIK